jgi:C4-type Zn-finger protein
MSTDNGADDTFDCPVCGASFDTKVARDKHLEQPHPD